MGRKTKRAAREESSDSEVETAPVVTKRMKSTKADTSMQSEPEAVPDKLPYADEFHLFRLVGLKGLLDAAGLNDISFKIGPKEKVFNTNRLPLASISRVLKEKIAAEAEKGSDSDGVIVLNEGFTPKAFGSIIRFAYGHDPEVTPQNAIEVANATKLLEISCLESHCLEFIKTVLSSSEDNLIGYMETATTFQNEAIIKICFESLQARGGVPAFMDSPAFIALPEKLINMILKLDMLPVFEPVIWEACLKWATSKSEANGTELKKELRKVYQNVRFPLCTAAFFSMKVVPTGVLSQEEMLKLFSYLTFPAGNACTEPFSKKPRHIWAETEVMRNGLDPVGTYKGDLFNQDGIDGISFSVSHELELLGVGVMVGEGSSKGILKIFEGQGEDRVQIAKARETIKKDDKQQQAHKMAFAEPIKLKKDIIYEVELELTGPGVALRMNQGQSEVEFSKNGTQVDFSFSKYKSGASETSVKRGNLPSLFVRILSS